MLAERTQASQRLEAGPDDVDAAEPTDDQVLALLRWGAAELWSAGIETDRLDAELLLADCLGCERIGLYLEPRRTVFGPQAARFRGWIQRRRAREPLAYLTGRKEFWGLDFEVGPGVLVPRPETERIVEAVLQRFQHRHPRTILDLCCGAGPLAVALGSELGDSRVIAVDASEPALSYARRNVQRHGLESRTSLVASDGLSAFGAGLRNLDLIVCNPPYIPSDDICLTMPEVSLFEPRLALDGGRTGLELTARLLREARERLAEDGVLVLETGAGLMPALVELANGTGFVRLEVLRDLAGIERALWAERRP